MLLYDCAILHLQSKVASAGKFGIVCNNNYCLTVQLPKFEKEVMYLLLILAIQITGGLICKENCRIIYKRSGNCHPLLFAATKFGWFMRTSDRKSTRLNSSHQIIS